MAIMIGRLLETDPTKLVPALSTRHMHAALILVDSCLAFGTLLSI